MDGPCVKSSPALRVGYRRFRRSNAIPPRASNERPAGSGTTTKPTLSMKLVRSIRPGNHHLKVHAPELVERLASRGAETDVVNKAFQRPALHQTRV